MGWARSWCCPSGRFRLGIATNSPEFPRMILSPRTTNESLSVMLTNALSLSSFLNETLTSVISIMCHLGFVLEGIVRCNGAPPRQMLQTGRPAHPSPGRPEGSNDDELQSSLSGVDLVQGFLPRELGQHRRDGGSRWDDAEHRRSTSGHADPRHSCAFETRAE